MFGLDDAVIGTLAGGLLNQVGASMRQDDAQAFSASQYANRYQTSVKDMKAAGINPMVAYGGLSSGAPQSSAASAGGFGDIGATMNQSKMASAQAANIEADTKNKTAAGDLMEAQAMEARSSAWRNMSASDLAQGQLQEIRSKLENDYYPNEVARLKAVRDELVSQMELNRQKGLTELQARELMQAQILNLFAGVGLTNAQVGKTTAETERTRAETERTRAETERTGVDSLRLYSENDLNRVREALGKLDLDAADKSGNFGRRANEYRIFSDMLGDIINNQSKHKPPERPVYPRRK